MASAEDAAAILAATKVARLLDLRSVDEWEPTPGLVEDPFELRPFSRGKKLTLPSFSSSSDNVTDFERIIADDAAANRLVRYHTPLLSYDRYYMHIFWRSMSPYEKMQAGRGFFPTGPPPPQLVLAPHKVVSPFGAVSVLRARGRRVHQGLQHALLPARVTAVLVHVRVPHELDGSRADGMTVPVLS
jgi:rhodanese-related sulfurtransferase